VPKNLPKNFPHKKFLLRLIIRFSGRHTLKVNTRKHYLSVQLIVGGANPPAFPRLCPSAFTVSFLSSMGSEPVFICFYFFLTEFFICIYFFQFLLSTGSKLVFRFLAKWNSLFFCNFRRKSDFFFLQFHLDETVSYYPRDPNHPNLTKFKS
jgi:hypothetical protein